MIKLALALLVSSALFGAKITNYNIYDRNDGVDIMVTFDEPYMGTIKQTTTNQQLTLKLQNAYIELPKSQQLESKYIEKISISQDKETLLFNASTIQPLKLQVSKTKDSFGLRMRFSAIQETVAQPIKATEQPQSLSALPTKKDDEMSTSYYVVMIVLIIGILILMSIRKKSMLGQTGKNPWLFMPEKTGPSSSQPASQSFNQPNLNHSTAQVNIRFQRELSPSHSVILLEYQASSYLLVLSPTNTTLLDKFTDNRPINQSDFETMLQLRNHELTTYLEKPEELTNEPLKSYKERAASIVYEN